MDNRDQLITKLEQLEKNLTDDPSTENFEFTKEETTDGIQIEYTGTELPTLLMAMLNRPDAYISRVKGKPKVRIRYRIVPDGEEYSFDEILVDIIEEEAKEEHE